MGELNTADDVIEREFSFPALDGYQLSGLWIAANNPTTAVLVQAGTGFPKEFYRRFARYGAQRGAACLLYDYRGIGGSAPESLAGMQMDYTDWGRLDLPAAIDALLQEYQGLPTGHVGHSVGGHFLGFAPNQNLLQRHAFVCVGSGYWADHFWANRPLELFFWLGYGPLCLAAKGYIPGGGPWAGAALPKGVFTTWRRWCLKHDYFLSELEGELRPHSFAEVVAPIRSFIFADDPIANARTAPDMLHAYPNAPSEIVIRAPAGYGLRRIGHGGAFRKASAALWPEIWDWVLAEPSARESALEKDDSMSMLT